MKKQMSSCLQIALVVAAAALLMPMSAKTANLPAFQVNAGEGFFSGTSFHFGFTGPNLSIFGAVELAPGPCGSPVGHDCGRAGDTINVDAYLIPDMPGSGMAGGISYPDLVFVGGGDFVGSPWIIPNAMDPILKEAFNVSNGASLWACVVPNPGCGPGGAWDVFNVVFVPTGELTIALLGPTQDGSYLLSSAVYSFGTTPEPSSIMLFGSGILGLAGVLRRSLG